MAWEKDGRYYTRSKKVGGRVVREYVGTGVVAELASRLDAISREKREIERFKVRAERAEVESLDAPLRELDNLVEMVAQAALLAAGFRQHHRGEWRKSRVRREESD